MFRLISFLVLLVCTAVPTAAQQRTRIDLNIPALELVVYEGDRVLETYPIAVGMRGFDTPTGTFSITHAEWNPWWRPPTHREWARAKQPIPPGPSNPMGRVKLFFMPLYFVHGTPDGESIGTPASHGCVRMRNEDVVALARLLHERAARQVSKAELDRLVARPGATRTVNFQEEVKVVIHYDAVVVDKSEIFVYPDIYNRNAIHAESVYQALIAAGYDVSRVAPADVRRFVDSAKRRKTPLVMKLDQAFGTGLVSRRS